MLTFKNLIHHFVVPLPQRGRLGFSASLRFALLSTADCQASATPKNASKGESQPKHFLGLKLIDKTIFCKVSLSKE